VIFHPCQINNKSHNPGADGTRSLASYAEPNGSYGSQKWQHHNHLKGSFNDAMTLAWGLTAGQVI
jgi:hypothetical protein